MKTQIIEAYLGDHQMDLATGNDLTGYPSKDKPWLKNYSESWSVELVQQRTIYRNVYENNKKYLTNQAIKYKGISITYREMFEMIEIQAKALKQLGIRVGDCVNLCVTYTPETVCLVLACSKIGALANFINPLFSTEQKVARLNDTGSKVLIVLDVMFSYMEETLKK